MENLIASCQNDFLVIIAFRVWLKMAMREKILAHSNYGTGYEGIEHRSLHHGRCMLI